jgi:hypothetical protein
MLRKQWRGRSRRGGATMSKVIDLDVLQRFETHLGDLY